MCLLQTNNIKSFHVGTNDNIFSLFATCLRLEILLVKLRVTQTEENF